MESIYKTGSIFCKGIARPKEYADILTKAMAESDIEKAKKLVLEMQKLDVDKYAMNSWLFLVKYIAAKKPDIQGDNFFEASNINWTPAKAWLRK